jgi:serine phosphatase RsbU (regulator of sigma subunit)/anti-sigma regulatory factor (Ser/Thr protein kinase)/anti-anti-sigma regulatory factor
VNPRENGIGAGQDRLAAVGDPQELTAPDDRTAGAAEVVREVFDQLPVMVVAWEGPDHVAVAANEAYRRYVGRPGFIGSRWSEVMPEVRGQQFFELLDKVYTTGSTEVGSEWRFQIRRDETDQLHEIFVDFTVAPRFGADGRVVGSTCYLTDVTDRVHERHQAALRTAHAQERYEAVHDVVVELQRALLSMDLPVMPTAHVAARYLVAAQDQAAGGDWFDAIVLDNGHLALVVGDVVGHGVAASAAMGQLRAVLEELLRSETDLEAVLERLDAYAAHSPSMRAATVAVVVLDPETGQAVYARCGHPAPLVVREDGSVRLLDGAAGGPLGSGSTPHHTAHTTIGRGELVLMYSDGLVERTGQPLDRGVAELAEVAADAMTNRRMPVGAPAVVVDRVAALSLELMTRSGHEDDVTVLAVQRLRDPVAPLDLRLTATRESLHQVNAAFGTWLAGFGASPADRFALELAVTEAVTNVIEHAYPAGRPGPLTVTGEVLRAGGVSVRVTDEGRWRAPDPESTTGGRGLLLMTQVVDEAEVIHPPQSTGSAEGSRGTTVVLRHHAHRQAIMDSARGPIDDELGDERPVADFGVDHREDDHGPVVVLSGTVDLDTAERARAALLGASRGGVRSLTVDLTEVDQLASAGVRSLFEVREQLAANRKELVLVAEPGSAAAVVLELVALPYHHPAPLRPSTA